MKTFDRAQKALDRLDRNFGGIVISDVKMPKMDGIAFQRAVAAIDPDLPKSHDEFIPRFSSDKPRRSRGSSLHKAIELRPDFAEAYYNTACLYSLKNLVGKTCKWLRKSLILDKKFIKMAGENPVFDNIRNQNA